MSSDKRPSASSSRPASGSSERSRITLAFIQIARRPTATKFLYGSLLCSLSQSETSFRRGELPRDHIRRAQLQGRSQLEGGTNIVKQCPRTISSRYEGIKRFRAIFASVRISLRTERGRDGYMSAGCKRRRRPAQLLSKCYSTLRATYLFEQPLRLLMTPDTQPSNTPSARLRKCFWCSESSQHAQLKSCARCHDVIYCSKECQRAAWPKHK